MSKAPAEKNIVVIAWYSLSKEAPFCVKKTGKISCLAFLEATTLPALHAGPNTSFKIYVAKHRKSIIREQPKVKS